MTQRHPIQNEQMMFVTTVTKDRYPYFVDDAFARESVEALYRTQLVHAFFLFSFVVMPDHVHILVKIPAPEKISTVIKSYKLSVSRGIGNGVLWQPRFYVIIPNNPWKILSYIHHNPVVAGIVDDPKKYRWSSASGLWDVSRM